jgi:hypothetical protein
VVPNEEAGHARTALSIRALPGASSPAAIVSSGRPAGPATAPAAQLTGQGRNLALATWTFAINFWAWNLIGPLSTRYSTAMSLSSTQTALLVATPILVGSVGRIPVGALTDRFGGRRMFTAISLISIAPVLLVAFAGSIDSYALLLVFGFFLGMAPDERRRVVPGHHALRHHRDPSRRLLVALPLRQVRLDDQILAAVREPVAAHRQPAVPLRAFWW